MYIHMLYIVVFFQGWVVFLTYFQIGENILVINNIGVSMSDDQV